MIDVLLLPFICLSIAQSNPGKANRVAFSMNEISSISGDDSLKNESYKNEYRARKASSTYYKNYFSEQSNSHGNFRNVQNFQLPDGEVRENWRVSEIDGSLSSSNKENQYIKRRTYKSKVNHYINQLIDTHRSVERTYPRLPYPTYDMWFHHDDEKEIVSDCQGTFKAYTSLADLAPLFKVE